MKIMVNTHTVFCIYTGFIVNRFTAGIVCRKLRKEGIILTKQQLLLVFKESRLYKKSHPDWTIAEIENQDGSIVKIKL